MTFINYILFLIILAALTLGSLFGVDISETQGFSVKNIVLYVAVLVVLGGQINRLSRVRLMPAYMPFMLLFLLAALSILYAPIFAGHAMIDVRSMMVLYKNEVFDPFIIYTLGFFLISRPVVDARPLAILVACFGMLNIIALSSFITGINPFAISVVSHHGTRFASFGGLANQGAYALLLFLPFYYYFYETSQSIKGKVFFMMMMLTALVGVGLTGSRGGYLLTTVLLLMMMLQTRRYGFFAAIIGIGVLGAVSYSALFSPDFIYNAMGRMELLVGQGEEAEQLASVGIHGIDAVSAGRTMIWRGIISVLADDPLALLVGKGWGTYIAHTLHTEAGGSAAHNVYLKVLLELGLAGLLLLLIAGWQIWRYYRRNVKPRDPLLYQCILSALLVVGWTYMLSAPSGLYTIWAFTFGLIAGISVYLHHDDVVSGSKTMTYDSRNSSGLLSRGTRQA